MHIDNPATSLKCWGEAPVQWPLKPTEGTKGQLQRPSPPGLLALPGCPVLLPRAGTPRVGLSHQPSYSCRPWRRNCGIGGKTACLKVLTYFLPFMSPAFTNPFPALFWSSWMRGRTNHLATSRSSRGAQRWKPYRSWKHMAPLSSLAKVVWRCAPSPCSSAVQVRGLTDTGTAWLPCSLCARHCFSSQDKTCCCVSWAKAFHNA